MNYKLKLIIFLIIIFLSGFVFAINIPIVETYENESWKAILSIGVAIILFFEVYTLKER